MELRLGLRRRIGRLSFSIYVTTVKVGVTLRVTEPENARVVWQGFITQRVMATFVRRISHAVGFGSFNRVPSGPRAKVPTGGDSNTRGVAHAVKRMCHLQLRAVSQPDACTSADRTDSRTDRLCIRLLQRKPDCDVAVTSHDIPET